MLGQRSETHFGGQDGQLVALVKTSTLFLQLCFTAIGESKMQILLGVQLQGLNGPMFV